MKITLNTTPDTIPYIEAMALAARRYSREFMSEREPGWENPIEFVLEGADSVYQDIAMQISHDENNDVTVNAEMRQGEERTPATPNDEHFGTRDVR